MAINIEEKNQKSEGRQRAMVYAPWMTPHAIAPPLALQLFRNRNKDAGSGRKLWPEVLLFDWIDDKDMGEGQEDPVDGSVPEMRDPVATIRPIRSVGGGAGGGVNRRRRGLGSHVTSCRCCHWSSRQPRPVSSVCLSVCCFFFYFLFKLDLSWISLISSGFNLFKVDLVDLKLV